MRKSNIGRKGAKLETIRKTLSSTTLNSIRGVLPDQAVMEACQEAGYRSRTCLIGPVVTVLHMIAAAIWPEASLGASWELIWSSLVSRVPEAAGEGPGSGSVSKARKRLPWKVWETLWTRVSQKAQVSSEPYAPWRGHRVVLADGTCVSMPAEDELFEAFGTNGGSQGKGKYPLARLVSLALANTMSVIGYAMGRYEASEIGLLEQVLRLLRPGDLLVADRCYAAAHYYARYLARGLQFLTRANQSLKLSRLTVLWGNARDDFVADVRINKKYRKQDPALPESVRVRFIQCAVRIRGKREVLWLATSLLDAQRYPAAEVAALYARRWRIETLFRSVKVNLSADVLRSKTANGIRKEVAARLIALNILRILMLEAAQQNQVDPMRIRFSYAVRAVLSFAPAMAREPVWRLPEIYTAMLTEIASRLVPNRPGRNEPRAIRRERKHYPTLKTTRDQWRRANAA